MTQKFNVRYLCEHCQRQSTAETGFGRWMRAQPSLSSAPPMGIVRTDCDHIILRYMTSEEGREFQLMMVVEVKERGAEPDPCQKDILQFLAHSMMLRGKNQHGAVTEKTRKIKSLLLNRRVCVRNYGVHLLQFEKTNPDDSDWIKWDRKAITKEQLVGLLALELHPFYPEKNLVEFLRDRHAKKRELALAL